MAFLGNDFTTGPKTSQLEMTEADIDKLIDEQVIFEAEEELQAVQVAPVSAPVSMSVQTDPIPQIETVKEGKDMAIQTIDAENDLTWHHIRDPNLCESLQPPRPTIKFVGKQLLNGVVQKGVDKEIEKLRKELIALKHKYCNDTCVCSGSSCTKILYKEEEGYKAHFHHDGFCETLRYCSECPPERKLNKFYGTPDRLKNFRDKCVMENCQTKKKTLLRQLGYCDIELSESESESEIDVEEFLEPSIPVNNKRKREEEEEPIQKKPKKNHPFCCPWCGESKKTKRLLCEHFMSTCVHKASELKNIKTKHTVKINIKLSNTIFDWMEKGTDGAEALKKFGLDPENIYKYQHLQCKCGKYKTTKTDKFYAHICSKHLKNKTGDRKADLLTCKMQSMNWLREDIDLVPWEKYKPGQYQPKKLESGSYAL